MTIYLTLFIHFATLLPPTPLATTNVLSEFIVSMPFAVVCLELRVFVCFFAHSELHVNLCSLWFSAILELPPSFPNTKAQVACRVLAYLSWLYLNQINPFGNILEAMFSCLITATSIHLHPQLPCQSPFSARASHCQLSSLRLSWETWSSLPYCFSIARNLVSWKKQTENQARVITVVKNDWRTSHCPSGSGPRCEMSLCSTQSRTVGIFTLGCYFCFKCRSSRVTFSCCSGTHCVPCYLMPTLFKRLSQYPWRELSSDTWSQLSAFSSLPPLPPVQLPLQVSAWLYIRAHVMPQLPKAPPRSAPHTTWKMSEPEEMLETHQVWAFHFTGLN